MWSSPPNFLLALWLLPLAGSVLIWTLGPFLRRTAGVVGSLAILVPFVFAIVLWPSSFAPGGLKVHLFDWVHGFTFGLWLDPLSLLWTCIIAGVGGLIHVYSIGYMWSDRAIARFFAYMNFFVFAMLTLVLSDNFVGLLAGWGLVGAASYFLIGFWFLKPTAKTLVLFPRDPSALVTFGVHGGRNGPRVMFLALFSAAVTVAGVIVFRPFVTATSAFSATHPLASRGARLVWATS